MHRRWWIDWAPTASPTTVAPRPIRHSPGWGEHAQEVVSRAEVKAEYFTISASGVVHLKAGARSEFAPLGEWMREKSIFNVLTRMKFFKHYLVYKCYHSWRSSVRQKLFAQVSSFGVVCGPRCV